MGTDEAQSDELFAIGHPTNETPAQKRLREKREKLHALEERKKAREEAERRRVEEEERKAAEDAEAARKAEEEEVTVAMAGGNKVLYLEMECTCVLLCYMVSSLHGVVAM